MNRRRLVRVVVPAVTVVVAAVSVTALSQVPVGAAFMATTANGGNSVSAAANFCVAPGTKTTVTPPADDVYIDQANPTTNYYTGLLSVQPGSSVTQARRTMIRFTDPNGSLPTPPHDCTVTAATLRVYNRTPFGGRQIDVYRISPTSSWTPNAVTWNTRPSVLTTSIPFSNAPSSAGWQQWNVTTLVTDMYAYGAGGDNGFQLRDHSESTTTTADEQVYDDLQATNPAQLVITWG